MEGRGLRGAWIAAWVMASSSLAHAGAGAAHGSIPEGGAPGRAGSAFDRNAADLVSTAAATGNDRQGGGFLVDARVGVAPSAIVEAAPGQAEALIPIPELPVWAMMLLGFAGVGLGLRGVRRRKPRLDVEGDL